MAVEGLQSRLQAGWKLERIELSAAAAALLGHILPDIFPEVAIDRHLVAGDVFSDGHAGQLHDAAFDGIHEREVAHGPGKERALRIAGAAQEEGSGGEIYDARDTELPVHGFQAGDPEAGGLVVLLGLLSLVALQLFFVRVTGFSR